MTTRRDNYIRRRGTSRGAFFFWYNVPMHPVGQRLSSWRSDMASSTHVRMGSRAGRSVSQTVLPVFVYPSEQTSAGHRDHCSDIVAARPIRMPRMVLERMELRTIWNIRGKRHGFKSHRSDQYENAATPLNKGVCTSHNHLDRSIDCSSDVALAGLTNQGGEHGTL